MLSIKINCDIIHQDWKTFKTLKYYVYKIFENQLTGFFVPLHNVCS